MTSPGRIRTPYSTSVPPLMIAVVAGAGSPNVSSGPTKAPVGRATTPASASVCVSQAKGLKSSGATIPPCTVVAAYSASQNSFGAGSG